MAETKRALEVPMPDTPANGDSAEDCLRLLVQHRPAIHAYIATLLPNPSDAEEVLQEASIIAWRKLGEFVPGTNFVGWVCGIAHLEALKFRRQQKHGNLLFGEQLISQLATEQAAQPGLWDDRRTALANCIAKLSPTDRELLHAAYDSGVTAKEAAAKLGRPANTVYKALNRIRERLFECVERILASGERS